MLVFVLQNILSVLGLLEQNIVLLCHYAERKRIMDSRIAIFVFLLFCSVSVLCMLCLFFSVFGEFQAAPVGLEYELQRVELFSVGPFGCKYS